MLAEINVVPLSRGIHQAEDVSEVVRLIVDSGLSYQVTSMGTLVEGAADDVWRLVRRCHECAMESNQRVMTEIRIDDRTNARGELQREVARIEELLAQPLEKSSGPPATPHIVQP